MDQAFSSYGGFLLDLTGTQVPWDAALRAAHALFALLREEKLNLAIERSPHFRGWSEMHNERDWREQIHLGREVPAAGQSPPFLRLEGPNLWPAEPGWRNAVESYMDAASELGETVLRRTATALGVSGQPFDGLARSGHLVMKMIGYHPQRGVSHRPGVAAHVDFSWLTLTLQDSPGLSIRSPDGEWAVIEPLPNTLWVHPGELLQFATSGRYRATPHRVINRSAARTRVSIPLFMNPALDAEVPLFANLPMLVDVAADQEPPENNEHVHRVLRPDGAKVPFHFGQAEWRRKGRGAWCAICTNADWEPSTPPRSGT